MKVPSPSHWFAREFPELQFYHLCNGHDKKHIVDGQCSLDGTLLIWVSNIALYLMLGKTEGRRRKGRQRMNWLDGLTNSVDMSLSKLGIGAGQGGLACGSPWGHKESDITERLNLNRNLHIS